MSGTWETLERGRELLAAETGTACKEAEVRVALLYPSPYRVAMSSLGYQAIYGVLNDLPGVAADRAVLPEDTSAYRRSRIPVFSLERQEPIGQYPVVAASVAYELEIPGLLECLDLSGIPVLAAEREATHPLVIAGGPLTFSNPVPLGPFCDIILMGEAEESVPWLISQLWEHEGSRDAFLATVAKHSGAWVPSVHGEAVPKVAMASRELLPARSRIMTPHAELSSMFLTEAVRGCSRGCTYCVMRRSTNGGMRVIDPGKILGGIPEAARRVGLVGASVTDHPRIAEIVRGIVESGREVGISSLRADRLSDELVGLLARGGYRTLTVASDGASERLRAFIERKTYERHLLRAAELAKKHGLTTLKIYMMVGLPGEEEADIDELVRFTLELARIHPRVALGVSPFVAKRNTPLDRAPWDGIGRIERKLERLRLGLKGRATVRPTSSRWGFVEYMLAQGDMATGLAAMDAWRAGGSFAAWKKALAARGHAM
ncbi:MAG: radical SAM protein [Deltaproteobacteria bacterium]|nr:radical SAM protein [Deltaproteobacteria bacterium]